MPKDLMKMFGLAIVVTMISGCAGGGLTVRRYVMDKERIDQDLAQGNQGYLMGQGSSENQAERKKTKRVYVVEFTKEPAESETQVTVPPRRTRETVTTSLPPETRRERQPPAWSRPVEVPSFDEAEPGTDRAEPSEMTSQSEMVEYTVQKGDTLQKISKKFYDSYSKWPRIYDLNKDVIKDPNRVSPGMVIRIPVDAKSQPQNLK